MLSRYNPVDIIWDHIHTIYDYSKARDIHNPQVDLGACLVFFGIPLLAALAVVHWLEVRLGDSGLNAMLTAFSLFAGLLLNMLILVYTVIKSIQVEMQQASVPTSSAKQINLERLALAKELYYNISFGVLVSMAQIVCLLLGMWDRLTLFGGASVVNFAVVWLAGIFVLTLLMVLKRSHVLMATETSMAIPSPPANRTP